MRIRFTSPHPKDFPDEVLQLVAERANVCNALHLPAQSGSSACLQRMGRGYTREAYLALVERARALIPAISLSSDFISGFCGETEAEHAETLSLIEEVGYDTVFCFPYSQRKVSLGKRRETITKKFMNEDAIQCTRFLFFLSRKRVRITG